MAKAKEEMEQAPGKAAGPTVEPPADLAVEAAEVIPPELVAQSLGQYVRARVTRVAGGESGALPVILALILISVAFEVWTQGLFFSPDNLVNLFIESLVFMTLGMAEIFVLLLGEIDLSAGYVLAVAAAIAGILVQKPGADFPWWLAVVVAILCAGATGAVWGLLVARLHLPSFVVTLAGLLIMWGVMLVVMGNSGTVSISSAILSNQRVLYQLVNGNIPPLVGWIILAGGGVIYAVLTWTRDASRRRRGLVAPPVGLTVIKIVFLIAVGAAVVAICNVNRGLLAVVEGVPWAVPVVLLVLLAWVFLLQRTKFGRYVYAIGGNPDAARRAGVSLSSIRTWAFALCAATAGFSGILYLSWQGGTSTNVNGGQYVLYGVAAAVIGGTSLFGGRGKVSQAVLGGLVIGAIYNGLYLQGVQVQWQLIATGMVLVGAVLVDTLSRRGTLSGSATRI